MSFYAFNYAAWTGLSGALIEYYRRGGRSSWGNLLKYGFLEKGAITLITTYLQSMNFPVLGSDQDANFIYGAILGALTELYRKDRSMLAGSEEQVLSQLIGHRLAANWGTAFSGVGQALSSLPFISWMFNGSSGYVDARISGQGTPIPSQNSGNPATT